MYPMNPEDMLRTVSTYQQDLRDQAAREHMVKSTRLPARERTGSARRGLGSIAGSLVRVLTATRRLHPRHAGRPL
jgi:hypothetical protein